MLTELSIKSFKAIKDKVEIPLKPFNVIIGRNGSGKSSAIEALNWLCTAVTDDIIEATRPFHRFEDIQNASQKLGFEIEVKFDPLDISIGESVYYSLFARKPDNGDLIISSEILSYLKSDGIEERIKTPSDGIRQYQQESLLSLTPEERKSIRSSKAKGTEKIKNALEKLEKFESASTLNPCKTILSTINPSTDRGGDMLRKLFRQAVFLRLNPRAISRFDDSDHNFTEKLLDEEGSHLARLLSNLNSEALEILLEKLNFITGRYEKCKVHQPDGPADRRYFEFNEKNSDGVEYQVPAWVLSEGTRRITAILALLLHDNPPPLLCIEEIENGLDPWTIKFLLEEFSSASLGNTQIILTTHSPYLLNYIPLENIILVNNEAGNVTFTSGEKIPNIEAILSHMGVGDLYVNHYLHEKAREVKG